MQGLCLDDFYDRCGCPDLLLRPWTPPCIRHGLLLRKERRSIRAVAIHQDLSFSCRLLSSVVSYVLGLNASLLDALHVSRAC